MAASGLSWGSERSGPVVGGDNARDLSEGGVKKKPSGAVYSCSRGVEYEVSSCDGEASSDVCLFPVSSAGKLGADELELLERSKDASSVSAYIGDRGTRFRRAGDDTDRKLRIATRKGSRL